MPGTLLDFYRLLSAEAEKKKQATVPVTGQDVRLFNAPAPVAPPVTNWAGEADPEQWRIRAAYPGGIKPDEYAEYVNPDYGKILGMLAYQGNKGNPLADTRVQRKK